MLDRELINQIEKLDYLDLLELRKLVNGLLGKPVSYQLKKVGNKYYWYAYWRDGNRVRCKYIGKEKKAIPLAEIKPKGGK